MNVRRQTIIFLIECRKEKDFLLSTSFFLSVQLLSRSASFSLRKWFCLEWELWALGMSQLLAGQWHYLSLKVAPGVGFLITACTVWALDCLFWSNSYKGCWILLEKSLLLRGWHWEFPNCPSHSRTSCVLQMSLFSKPRVTNQLRALLQLPWYSKLRIFPLPSASPLSLG